MGKALKPLALAAGIGLQFIPGVGNFVGGLILGSGASAMGGALLGTIITGAIGGGLGLYGLGAFDGRKSFRGQLSPFDPKSINPDPAAPRKIVLGETAFPVDLRYAEPSGTNQEYIDYVFALAAHKSDTITQIYIEDDLAWTSAGGAQGKYAGYLTVEVILEAGAGAFHTVNGGGTWGASTRLTGCTTMRVRVKRSDNSKTSQSPFASGINGRWAVIGRGMPVYDPARDSTVAGGSGTQRATDNSTWAYTATVARGNNPALQLLSYLLGWRIGGVVSVGVGLPVDTIDVASFATAAALCDESVALAAGGSQRRFEAGRAFSDADDPMAVIKTLLDAMNGELVDDGGRLALRLAVNDLTPALTLTDDDFVSGYAWKPAAPIEQQFTAVRGRYSQPAAPTLYGMVDYPEVAIPRTSLAPRVLTLELSAVQDQRRAERIAKQAAQRNLYQGTFSVTLGARGWLLRRNMVIAVTSSARGWTAKLFRVRSLTFNPDASVEVLLREEHASIYAWAASESAVVTPVAPVVFDSRAAASWLMAGIEPQANLTAPNGANRVPFSRMEGDQGWAGGTNPPGGVTGLVYFTFQGRRAVVAQATASAAGQFLFVTPAPLDDPLIKVEPNERMSISFRVGGLNASGWQMNFRYRRADGSINEIFIASGSTFNWTVERQTTFFDVPSDARLGMPKLYIFSAAAGACECLISEPMLCGAADGQTVHPAFAPGPNAADAADVTRTILPNVPMGEWAAGVFFRAGESTFFRASTYTARIDHTSTTANRPPDATTWKLSAQAGDSSALVSIPLTTVNGSATIVVGSFNVRAGNAGEVVLGTDITVTNAATSASTNGGELTWQRETSPGTWANVGVTLVTASLAPGASATGQNVARTATGLTAGSVHAFRLIADRDGPAFDPLNPSANIIRVSGSISGQGQ